MYNPPSNSTVNILKDLITEMAGLFPDEIFNVGADEVSWGGHCN